MLIIDTHCPRRGIAGSSLSRRSNSRWIATALTKPFSSNTAALTTTPTSSKKPPKRSGRFKVAVLVDPESPRSTRRSCAARRARGPPVCALPPSSQFANAGPYDMWHRAGELGLVVSSIGNASQFATDDFSRVLDACPDTHVNLEHLAGVGHCRAALRRLRPRPCVRASATTPVSKFPA